MDRMQKYQAPGHSLLDEPKAIGHLKRESEGFYSFPQQLVTLEPEDKVEAIVATTIIEGKIAALDQLLSRSGWTGVIARWRNIRQAS